MKKLLLIIALVVALGVAALAIFMVTFDADRYRPLLTQQLTQALGKPVTLGRLSLGWQGGVAVRAQEVAIAEGGTGGVEPLLHVASISAVIRPLALLRKRLEVSSIVLTRPRIHILRDAQGQLNLTGLAAVAAPAAQSNHGATMSDSPFSFHVGSLRITAGNLHWTDAMHQPPTDLTLHALEMSVRNIAGGQPMDIELKGMLASSTPNLMLSGRLMLPGADAAGAIQQIELRLEHVPLELIVPATSDSPQPRGKLTVAFQGQVPTLDAAQLAQSVSGSATIQWADPVVANLNILREVFNRLSVIPGLVEKLQQRLPSEYHAKLTATDTVLSPVECSGRISDGTLQVDALRLETEDFALVSEGRLGLDGTMDLRSVLRVTPALSSALIASVNELQALANAKGELEMPVMIQGNASQIAVLPDLQYVASKVLATKVVDVLGRFLEDRQAPAQDTPEASSTDDLLGSFLQRALERHAPAEQTP